VNAVLAAFRKELRSLVALPQTYAIGAAFLALSGAFFLTFLAQSNLPDLEQYYSNMASTLLVLVPVIAMRSFAEERRTGALDMSLSWPAPRSALVVARYAVNTLYAWVLLSVAWLYVWLLRGMGEVEVGKALSGFTGMLLLAAALGALSLAVSARAASPAGAAFGGFGLLLGLWTLQYAPRWLGPGGLGGWTAGLSPATHLEAAARGVLGTGDAGWFAACAVVGLGLAVHALERQRPGVARRTAGRRRLLLAAVAGAGLAVSTAGAALGAQADLTPTRRFTGTRQTRQAAKRASGPVHVTGFVDPGSAQAVQMRALVRAYQAARIPVQLELVDPDEQPGRAKALGVARYGQMLVETNGRRELVSDPEEIALTSAILRLTREHPATACFTVGHGEGDINDGGPAGYDGFAAALRQLGFATEPLALGAPGGQTRLDGCAVVVTGPRIPLLPAELSMLEGFLQRDGRLVVMADPEPPARQQLNALLRPWGLVLSGDAVRDRSSLADDPASVVAFSYPSDSPPVRDLKRAGIPVLLADPRPLERAVAPTGSPAGAVAPLVSSSSHSEIPGSPLKGPFVLAALVDDSHVTTDGIHVTRIGVVGTSGLASNRLLDSFGNRTFATGLVQWVAREADVISAGRDFGGVHKIVLTDSRRDHLVRAGIVFPSLAFLVPFPVALLRLRRG
jgi:ABC-2 type transport system permease protein